MIFCKCGKIMDIRDDGLRMAFCSCGNKHLVLGGEITVEDNTPKTEIRNSEVVKTEHVGSGFPHNCSKCGYGEADVIELGIFYSDEAAVYLFKCKKCGWSERQSDGTGN
jgi:DNA-directed RNA polymerase subunit M/transcription elongation factor TFIIS